MATKVQANWTNVAFANTTITRVSQVSFNQGGQLTSFAGDDDAFDTVQALLMSKPTASVNSADAGTLMGIAPGTTGALTATHRDALYATNGAIVYTLANAVAETAQTSGSFGQFGTASISFKCFSSDGATNPLSFARA